jgi:hypothetical protein
VKKLLTTFLALAALAMGLSHGSAIAVPAMVAPVVMAAEAESASADLPCHGSAADEALPDDATDSGQSAPDCCPDGCKGGCAMLAALPGAAVASLPEALHGQTALPVEARAPADHPNGLKRPPRATA